MIQIFRAGTRTHFLPVFIQIQIWRGAVLPRAEQKEQRTVRNVPSTRGQGGCKICRPACQLQVLQHGRGDFKCLEDFRERPKDSVPQVVKRHCI